ncbi:hypothetical protein M885DRAFT_506229 [Pelagophyceae sp. CCMP2097]|nr:hypothetical protein M885DRAFT_506229 [Pelagophyceae sp. CCMP2097]
MPDSDLSAAALAVASAFRETAAAAPLEGVCAAVAAVGGALTAAAAATPAVSEAVAGVLVAFGQHLPVISVAVGVLGALVLTFQLSRDNDANVRTVRAWTRSVRDWLLLVAERVDRSGAESTLHLFVALRDASLALAHRTAHHDAHWRVTKMLASATFHRDFERAKQSVFELKAALRDFLDAEAQAATELSLAATLSATMKTHDKLDSLEAQLAQIHGLLQAPRGPAAAATPPEERVFSAMQAQAGCQGAAVPLDAFAACFELYFFDGGDLPRDVEAALLYEMDRSGDGLISKVEWLKFFKKWVASKQTMAAFLQGLATARQRADPRDAEPQYAPYEPQYAPYEPQYAPYEPQYAPYAPYAQQPAQVVVSIDLQPMYADMNGAASPTGYAQHDASFAHMDLGSSYAQPVAYEQPHAQPTYAQPAYAQCFSQDAPYQPAYSPQSGFDQAYAPAGHAYALPAAGYVPHAYDFAPQQQIPPYGFAPQHQQIPPYYDQPQAQQHFRVYDPNMYPRA